MLIVIFSAVKVSVQHTNQYTIFFAIFSLPVLVYSFDYPGAAAPAGTQLSHPLVFPQQNVTRSFPSSFTNVVHPSSVMRFAGIDSGGQVGYQMPQPSTAATTMMNIIQSRFGNARAFQANDVVPHSLPPSQAVIDAQSRARLQRTVLETLMVPFIPFLAKFPIDHIHIVGVLFKLLEFCQCISQTMVLLSVHVLAYETVCVIYSTSI